MDDTLTQALELAKRGYHLFPLAPGGKTPALTGNWQNAATTDARVLQRWFARTNCNIGVACEPSGIFAIDLDTAKPGIDGPAHGIETLRQLADGRDLPRTLSVATPSGGTHLYFRQPTEGTLLRNTARRLGPLIDTRGIGGYLVAPGSRINDVSYRITDDVPLAEVPTWITTLLRPPEPTREQLRPARPGPSELGNPYARAALGRETAHVAAAKPGQRNHTLNQAAYSLGRLIADGLLDRSQVEGQLTLAAQAAGLGHAEAEATLRSGIIAGLEHHRSRTTTVHELPDLPTKAAPFEWAAPSRQQPTTATADPAREAGSTTPAKTLAALHAAFDALERELDEPVAATTTNSAAGSNRSQDGAELSAEAAADLLDQAVSPVRDAESRAQALGRTPEWHKIRAIGRAATELVRQVRQAAREHTDDLRTDIYIHGALRTITARTCRQIGELASTAAERLAHRGLTDSPTYTDLCAVQRVAHRTEAKLTGRAPGLAEPEQHAAARKQLKQIRRDLRKDSRVSKSAQTPPRPTPRAATSPTSRRP